MITEATNPKFDCHKVSVNGLFLFSAIWSLRWNLRCSLLFLTLQNLDFFTEFLFCRHCERCHSNEDLRKVKRREGNSQLVSLNWIIQSYWLILFLLLWFFSKKARDQQFHNFLFDCQATFFVWQHTVRALPQKGRA